MKRFLSMFAIMVMAVMAMSVNAQTRYSGSVGFEMGGALNEDSEYTGTPFATTIVTEQGLLVTNPNWNTSVFFGGATGLDIWYTSKNYQTMTQLAIPVYFTMKALFNKNGAVQPYVKGKAGWEGFIYNKYTIDFDGHKYTDTETELTNSFLTGAEVGLSIPLEKKHKHNIEVGVGYTLNLTTYDNYPFHRIGGAVRYTF